MPSRTVLALSEDALSVIEANATERKRGEFVSSILVDYARVTGGISTLGDDDDGILERIDSRLARIEKQMAILLAECAGSYSHHSLQSWWQVHGLVVR